MKALSSHFSIVFLPVITRKHQIKSGTWPLFSERGAAPELAKDGVSKLNRIQQIHLIKLVI